MYKIKVTKEGFITKVIDIDTTVPDWYQGAYTYWFDMDMVKMPFKEFAQSVKVGSVKFNEATESFANNWELTQRANDRIHGELAKREK